MPENFTFFFEDDGVFPNNRLPVILYKEFMSSEESHAGEYLERLFRLNNWTNNWRDIIVSKHHYHSSTHEVLGISKGSVLLQLGGPKGEQLLANVGDILIIPAGVAHKSLDNGSNYEVVGGYPDGRSWDMIYNEPEKYKEAKKEIDFLPLPGTDPVYGTTEGLVNIWKSN